MKGQYVAAGLAALAGSAAAGPAHQHRGVGAHNAHNLFHNRRAATGVSDQCTTIYTTITGPPGLWTPPVTSSVPTQTTAPACDGPGCPGHETTAPACDGPGCPGGPQTTGPACDGPGCPGGPQTTGPACDGADCPGGPQTTGPACDGADCPGGPQTTSKPAPETTSTPVCDGPGCPGHETTSKPACDGPGCPGHETTSQPAPETTATPVCDGPGCPGHEATSSPAPTSTGPPSGPTPQTQTCSTTGIYSFPPTTIVVTETETVCGASSTVVPPGTHTLGGVTTVVETATTVTCPVATTTTQPNGAVTSVVTDITYVCPTAGTYTISPVTSTVTGGTKTVYVPVVETFTPGTYTAPALVTTITETDVTIVCPFDNPTPTPSTTAVVEPTTTAAPETTVAKPSSTSEAVPTSSSVPDDNTPKGGKQWAMTYTPYNNDNSCKSKDQVRSEVKEIKDAGFTTMRVYSTDCHTLEYTGAAAREFGMKLIIGIFVGEDGCHNSRPSISTQIDAIKEWAQWDMTEIVVVGNEALQNGFCTAGELSELIHKAKEAFTGAGYSGPFTTTDVVGAWQNTEGIEVVCAAIDEPSANIHAYFDANTSPDEAGTFVASQLDMVKDVCGSTGGWVMECGWPTAGKCNGKACPGEKEQTVALKKIEETLGDVVVFFSAQDDLWKAPGACNCEQSWGCLKQWI